MRVEDERPTFNVERSTSNGHHPALRVLEWARGADHNPSTFTAVIERTHSPTSRALGDGVAKKQRNKGAKGDKQERTLT